MIDENIINELVRRKVVSDTFRRLRPDKKEMLYKTALRLFGKYGYDGLSVEHYCHQTKISKGSFFQYFPSKTHLLECTLLLFDQRLLVFVSLLNKQESKVLVKDRLHYLLSAAGSKSGLEDVERKFYLFATNGLYHSAVTVEGINIARHFTGYIADIIKRGAETGEIRTDFLPAVTGEIVAGAFHSILNRYFLTDVQPDELTVRSFISIIFDGVSA